MIVWGGYVDGAASRHENSGGRYDPVQDSWTSTNVINAPSARQQHTAIWSGSEMIIWGGYDGVGAVDSGGRYDPSNDSWTATATSEAPSARTRPTGVWTGAEMIVWGGSRNSDRFNTGGRYYPATDDWLPTSLIDAPAGRDSHTGVWTGTELIVWGGFGSAALGNGGRYNPATDTWLATSNTGAPEARYNHVAVWTGKEMIVWGGYKPGYYLNTGGRYDPDTDSWHSTTTSNAAHWDDGRTAVWGAERMIIWGGGHYDGIGHVYSTAGSLYDPVADSWTDTSTVNVPAGRINHSALWTGTQMIIWGGNIDNGGYVFKATGALYDPVQDSWKATATLDAPTARSQHSAIWTGKEMIIWGGYDGSNPNTGGRYSPSLDSWIPTTTVGAPAGNNKHAAVWTGLEMIIWGNYTNRDTAIYYPYDAYSIGGTVTGLAAGNSLTLQNNGGDDLVLSSNGTFSFANHIVNGASYDVNVLVQPAAFPQYCSVSNGNGVVSGTDVSDVAVACVDTYVIGGTISGLAAGNSVVLQNNASDDLVLTSDGNFGFATALPDGSSYDISVLTQPESPDQTCSIANNSGTIVGQNVDTIEITCVIDTYAIGGVVSGLVAGNTLMLQNNAGDDLTIDAGGNFVFATKLPDGSSYAVTISVQPSSPVQTCMLTNGSGVVSGADVTTVTVDCPAPPPLADAGADRSILTNTAIITLGGSPAVTYGTPPYTYAWSISPGVAGTDYTLGSTSVANPQFSGKVAGVYTAQLTVTDADARQHTDTATIEVSTLLNSLVQGVTLTGTQTLAACQSITVDSSTVVVGADVTMIAPEVSLGAEFSVLPPGILTVIIQQPTGCPSP